MKSIEKKDYKARATQSNKKSKLQQLAIDFLNEHREKIKQERELFVESEKKDFEKYDLNLITKQDCFHSRKYLNEKLLSDDSIEVDLTAVNKVESDRIESDEFSSVQLAFKVAE